METKALILAAADIARRAGAEIMAIYTSSNDLEIQSKADDSPLTRADSAANRIICDALQQLDPVLPIISEENKEIPYADRKDYTHFWLVDPLDGTKEFIKRNGEFTVNIALVEGQYPIGGVVFVPASDELYWAVQGLGAFRQKGEQQDALRAPRYTRQDAGLRVVCSRSHLNADTQAFIDALQNPEKVAKGSSLKFLSIASGEAHLYPRLGPTMEWDTGAAQIILEEAGGSVRLADGLQRLQYNKENLLNPYFIASGQEQA